MLRKHIIKLSGITFILLLLGACWGGGGGGGGGSGGENDDPSVAARTSLIAPGDADCVYGGVLVETGIDENANGILDASEVDESEKVCNGAPGTNGADGLNALVNISDEFPGANCATGGKRIDAGIDTNANDVLDNSEIVSTEYICNGTSGNNGLNALIDMNPEPVGVNCPNGGTRIDVGIDTNGNTTLDPAEITQTGFVCNGNNGSIGWQVATLIERENAGPTYDPQVAVDGSGNAVAVWTQSDGTRYNIWANRYVVGVGWGGMAELIETNNTGGAIQPQVAVDDSGNAVAVWAHTDGILYSIWANRYVVGVGWGGMAELIETNNTGGAIQPQVAVDGSGNAVAVWRQSDGTRNNIWANRYIPGFGWGTAELIETDNAGDAYDVQVAMNDSGNVVAVWAQYYGYRVNIWANRYVAGTGWGTAELIETDNAGDALKPQVAMDGSGNAVAVWYQSDGIRNNIWANRYEVGTGWGTAELIEFNNIASANSPQVAMDSSGNAVAVWPQPDDLYHNIWSNRYVVGTGWGTAELIETDNAGDAYDVQVAMNDSGNVVAVWAQYYDYRVNIWANRYVAGTGWGTAELIETDNAGDALKPQVAMDGSGNAVAVWHQNDGTLNNILANRYLVQ